jgi:hypothetical protein
MSPSPVALSSLQRAVVDDRAKKSGRFETSFDGLDIQCGASSGGSGDAATSDSRQQSESGSARLLRLKAAEARQRQIDEEEESKVRKMIAVVSRQQTAKNSLAGGRRGVPNREDTGDSSSVIANALAEMHSTDLAVLEGGSRRKKRSMRAAQSRHTTARGRRAPSTHGQQHASTRPNSGSKAKVVKANSGKRTKY